MDPIHLHCLDEAAFLAMIAGALTPDAERAAKGHLDACDACRELFVALARSPAGADAVHEEAAPAIGRYRLLSTVGAGGMGIVYAAYDPELERRVALKLLRPMREIGRAVSLAAEARAMAKVAHANVLAVHDAGAVDGQPFIAMELVEGPTLSAWLANEKPKIREIVDAFVGAGRGLAAAHDAGIVHGDFKPDNVLLGPDRRPRVTDFGLSRLAADPAGGRSSGGTPRYMAPELWRGVAPSVASDQFAFAVALWEALYGAPPFSGGTIEVLAERIQAGRVDPPPRARVPRGVRRVLERALAVEPAARFPSMAALLERLAAATQSRRRLVYVAILAAAFFATGMLVMKRPPPCASPDEKLAGIWDGPSRAAIRARFAASSLPHARDTWSRVEKELDRWTGEWKNEHVAACRATHVSREQSEELLDLRTACLERERDQLEALTKAFAEADQTTIRGAIEAIDGLPPVSQCADAESLRAGVQPPPKAVAGRVLAVRKQLASAHSSRWRATSADTMALAGAALTEARSIGYPPLEAEALAFRAEMAFSTGDHVRAEAWTREAAETAQVAGAYEVAARAWIKLVDFAVTAARYEDGHRWDGYAKAAIDRLRQRDDLHALRLHKLGDLLDAEGRYGEALGAYRDAQALFEKRPNTARLGRANARLKIALMLVRLARRAEAQQLADEALHEAIDVLGEENPRTGHYWGMFGTILDVAGWSEGALEAKKRALMLTEGVDSASNRAMLLGRIAQILLDLGRTDEAWKYAESARRILEETGDPSTHYGTTLQLVARVADRAGRHAEAVATLRRACDIAEKAAGSNKRELALCLADLANARLDQPDKAATAEGRMLAKRAVELVDGRREMGTLFPQALRMLAKAEVRAGAPREAVVTLERAIAWFANHDVPETPQVTRALAQLRLKLADVLWTTGRDRQRAAKLVADADQALSAIGDTGPLKKEATKLAARFNRPRGHGARG